MSDEIRQALADLLGSMPSDDVRAAPHLAARRMLDRLVADGWTRVGLATALGGSGGGIREAASVTAACAASGHLLPVADMVVCSARLLEIAGLELPADIRCAVPVAAPGTCDRRGRIQVRAQRVPWARWASHFLVIASCDGGAQVSLVDAAAAEISAGRSVAGEARDGVVLMDALPVCSASAGRALPDVLEQVQLAGALARSVQMAAGTEKVLQLSVRYCLQRRQFGRSLAEFQAVQQQLAGLAGESAAASAAVAHALDGLPSAPADWLVAPVAVAKIRTGMAAGAAARAAHQVHGAIGITQEYPLHRHTTALWSWREEYGGEQQWARALAGALVSGSADPWQAIAPA